jgi:hypothetical protein
VYAQETRAEETGRIRIAAGIFSAARGILTLEDSTLLKRTVFGGLVAVVIMNSAVPSGPKVGEAVPDFRLSNQHGSEKTLRSILGPKGALLVFYRSADW